MYKDFLQDETFLTLLDKLKIKAQYAKIILLDFAEKPIKEIQGNITAGSLSVNGSAAIRRTINLTMLANKNNNDIENIENEISINKKIKIEIGYANPLKEYSHYGDIVWFPCGLYVVGSANISKGTNTYTITIQGKDKMVMLDGSVGGTLPAAVTFHERYEMMATDQVIVSYPTIVQIIRESVSQYGGEPLGNIFINGLDETAKLLIKYIGNEKIYFTADYSSFTFDSAQLDAKHEFETNQDIGYKEIPFKYPGELVLKAGDTVVSLLDKISKTLGNFEFFYDLDGHFIFQEKKNYSVNSPSIIDLNISNYFPTLTEDIIAYSITDFDQVSQINKNPKYDNIKNDFIIWGQRTTIEGAKRDILYHLAIDKKPALNLCLKEFYKVEDIKTKKVVYKFKEDLTKEENYAFVNSGAEDRKYNVSLIGGKAPEWREELYRQALVDQSNGQTLTVYGNELLMPNYEGKHKWRTIYNPIEWEETNGWNPELKKNPQSIDYWLDFIDETAAVGKYSVNAIGRRTKVVNDTKIQTLFNNPIPDVLFLSPEEFRDEDKIKHYRKTGQQIFQLSPAYENYFVASSTPASAFDKIRELLQQHLVYNTQITITCSPKYYYEPNNILHLQDKDSDIFGNYEIKQFNLPLTYNGTMSITLAEILQRV